MKKFWEVSLGVVTGIGGFLDVGSITTAAQAGALFGYQLAWAVVLGGLCVVFLAEQSGRMAAVSGYTIVDAIRERFGLNYYLLLLGVLALVMLLVLGAELGGVCVALEFATGIEHQWWALPVALGAWLILWKGKFSFIEEGVAGLGLVTVCFVVVAVMLHPDWIALARGAIPSLPDQSSSRYWFLAANIMGASITPYLMFFYSAGAVEDKWDTGYLVANRLIASLGMGFGVVISLGVLVVACMVLRPRGIQVEHYSQLALLLTDTLGRSGFMLLAASLGIACLGAGLEIALTIAYMTAQGFGWNWTQNEPPHRNARFSTVYSVVVLLGMLLVLTGVDPIKLTNLSMGLTAATLPVAIIPFLFLMNDERYVKAHRNGWLSNAVVLFIIGLASVLAIVTSPLEFLGGS